MATFYVDSSNGNDNNPGTLASPWQNFTKWITAAAGSELYFRGSASLASPRQYTPGGVVPIGRNYLIKNYPDEHVQFLDVNRDTPISFDRFTAGSILVQGTGSITWGPAKLHADNNASYYFGALQLAGCQNMLLDGGPLRRLIFNSAQAAIPSGFGATFGLLMAVAAGIGPRNITVQNYTATGNACGIGVRGGGTNTTPAVGGPGVIIQNGDSYSNIRMLYNIGSGSDSGAMGVLLDACDGVIVRANNLFGNWGPSLGYGMDGGGVEIFAAYNSLIENNVFYDNDAGIETGRINTRPFSTGNIIRRNVFRGTSNPGQKNPPTSPTILLRDFADGEVYHNTFYISDAGSPSAGNYRIIAIYPDPGQYQGLIDRVKIRNNIFYFQDTQTTPVQPIMQIGTSAAGFPMPSGANAVTIDYNIYYRPAPNTRIADAAPAGSTTLVACSNLAQYQAQGYEAHGIIADPQMVAPLSNDFTLQGNSPAKNVGIVIAGQTYIGAPDMGAFEAPAAATIYVNDPFSRTISGGFGTAPTGGPWTTAGGVAGDYNVNGSAGTITNTSNGTRNARLTSVAAQDITGSYRWAADKIPTGVNGSTSLEFWLRRNVAGTTDYRISPTILTGGGVRLQIGRQTAGTTVTPIAGSSVVTPAAKPTVTANEFLRVKFLVADYTVGTTTLRAKLWADGAAEPAGWDIQVTDTNNAGLTGHVQLFSYTGAPVTNGPIIHTVDDLFVNSPFELTGTLETGTGTDSSVLTIGITAKTGTDTAAGADASTAVVASHARTETAVGADVAVFTRSITATDTAAATDVSGDRAYAVVETPTGTDARAPFNAGLVDSFSREVSGGWGTADNGVAWVPGGATAAASNVDGSRGTMSSSAAGQTRRWYLPGSDLDFDIPVTFERDKLAVGGYYSVYVVGRQLNVDNDGYRLQVRFNTDQTVDLIAETQVGGTTTALATALNVDTDAAATQFTARFRGVGTSPTVLYAKVWQTANPEPDWDVILNDSTAALQVAGGRGVRTFSGSATNAPIVVSVDYIAANPFPFAVIAASQTGVAVDSSAETTSNAATDAGTAVDVKVSLAQGVVLAATETGVSTDTVVSLVADSVFVVSDTGLGVDMAVVSLLDTSLAGTDAAAALEAAVLAQVNVILEAAFGNDAGGLTTSDSTTDTGVGSDSGSLVTTVPVTSDSGSGSEGALLTAVYTAVETAVVADGAAFDQAFSLLETGVGVDTATRASGRGTVSTSFVLASTVSTRIVRSASVVVEIAVNG